MPVALIMLFVCNYSNKEYTISLDDFNCKLNMISKYDKDWRPFFEENQTEMNVFILGETDGNMDRNTKDYHFSNVILLPSNEFRIIEVWIDIEDYLHTGYSIISLYYKETLIYCQVPFTI